MGALQLCSDGVQREAGVGGAGGDDRQGKRQLPAQPDDLLHRAGLGRDPVGAQPALKGFPGGGHGREVQRDQPGAVGHGQTGQRVPAGRDHQASRGARQERANLPYVARVVQDNENALSGQDAPVHSGSRVEAVGYPPGRHPQRAEQGVQRVFGRGRGAAGVESTQIQVQLPVLKMPRRAMRPVNGEGGFPYPRHAIDYADSDGRGPPSSPSICAARDSSDSRPANAGRSAGSCAEEPGATGRCRRSAAAPAGAP